MIVCSFKNSYILKQNILKLDRSLGLLGHEIHYEEASIKHHTVLSNCEALKSTFLSPLKQGLLSYVILNDMRSNNYQKFSEHLTNAMGVMSPHGLLQ